MESQISGPPPKIHRCKLGLVFISFLAHHVPKHPFLPTALSLLKLYCFPFSNQLWVGEFAEGFGQLTWNKGHCQVGGYLGKKLSKTEKGEGRRSWQGGATLTFNSLPSNPVASEEKQFPWQPMKFPKCDSVSPDSCGWPPGSSPFLFIGLVLKQPV